jgi:glycosyltransferase involved in cell wall biosynthesis
MESLACGLCTVATRLSGIPELVREGETGLLVDPADSADLRETLEAALDGGCDALDPARGRKLVEEEFNVRRSADRLAGLLLGSTEAQPASTES